MAIYSIVVAHIRACNPARCVNWSTLYLRRAIRQRQATSWRSNTVHVVQTDEVLWLYAKRIRVCLSGKVRLHGYFRPGASRNLWFQLANASLRRALPTARVCRFRILALAEAGARRKYHRAVGASACGPQKPQRGAENCNNCRGYRDSHGQTPLSAVQETASKPPKRATHLPLQGGTENGERRTRAQHCYWASNTLILGVKEKIPESEILEGAATFREDARCPAILRPCRSRTRRSRTRTRRRRTAAARGRQSAFPSA